jgi:hypothetical protein
MTNDENDDFYSGNFDDLPGNSNFPDLQRNEFYEYYRNEEMNNNDDLDINIENVKKIREKKREIGHKEENYDQDFLETQNIKSQDYLGKIYKILQKDNQKIHLEQNTEEDDASDRELKLWEMNKINQGLATHCIYKLTQGLTKMKIRT